MTHLPADLHEQLGQDDVRVSRRFWAIQCRHSSLQIVDDILEKPFGRHLMMFDRYESCRLNFRFRGNNTDLVVFRSDFWFLRGLFLGFERFLTKAVIRVQYNKCIFRPGA
jgi:hypothetical protein